MPWGQNSLLLLQSLDQSFFAPLTFRFQHRNATQLLYLYNFEGKCKHCMRLLVCLSFVFCAQIHFSCFNTLFMCAVGCRYCGFSKFVINYFLSDLKKHWYLKKKKDIAVTTADYSCFLERQISTHWFILTSK